MTPSPKKIPYPRRRLTRGLARGLGRLLVPLLFKVDIQGQENFPESGPLIVVGNHLAVMETVMMTVFSPWPPEMLGSVDVPHELITRIMSDLYGYIPIWRGQVDRQAMEQALSVLEQGGILGLFPEGGIWDPGAMKAHTGVAWLSYRGKTPVLPIGFSGTPGALGAALRLEKPSLNMNVGKPMPPAEPQPGEARRDFFQRYAEQVLDAINALRPDGDETPGDQIHDENFELQVTLHDEEDTLQEIPDGLRIHNARALAKLLHRPGILKIFRKNLRLPVAALQELEREPEPEALETASEAILEYLKKVNPYLLTYRFGPKEAESMRTGLQELNALSHWAAAHHKHLHIVPVRRYYLYSQEEEIVQTRQDIVEDWM